MSWNEIKQEINTNIADNDHQLITAEKVRTTLLDIVGQTETVENEYKPTGLFFYFGDNGENECNCKISYVNFINEDGPEGDFYLVECYARYGLDDSLLFDINNPYGSMYSSTYSINLYDCAVAAFTKAFGAGHTPQIHKFDKNINLTTDYISNYYTGNKIIMVANVYCNDEYNGDVIFRLVSAYNQTNVPIAIKVGFRCWVQDVQQ